MTDMDVLAFLNTDWLASELDWSPSETPLETDFEFDPLPDLPARLPLPDPTPISLKVGNTFPLAHYPVPNTISVSWDGKLVQGNFCHHCSKEIVVPARRGVGIKFSCNPAHRKGRKKKGVLNPVYVSFESEAGTETYCFDLNASRR